MAKSKIFVCYSVPLLKFLLRKDIKYDIVGLHPETKKTFWGFVRNEDIDKALDEWKISKI